MITHRVTGYATPEAVGDHARRYTFTVGESFAEMQALRLARELGPDHVVFYGPIGDSYQNKIIGFLSSRRPDLSITDIERKPIMNKKEAYDEGAASTALTADDCIKMTRGWTPENVDAFKAGRIAAYDKAVSK